MKRVPATVITGFLGAGKTTLVRHLLEHANGRRIALIVNEFGDQGVDGSLLEACDLPNCGPEDIVELANGCLCCTVADEFLPTMERLLDRALPPEHIVIETSGLALPKPLVKAFDWPTMRPRVTVDGVVVVVDGPAFAAGRFASSPAEMAKPDHDNPIEETFVEQLGCADLVLLNKSDLIPTYALPEVEAALAAKLRPGVQLVSTRHGAVDARLLLGLEAAAEDDLAARPSLHDSATDHDHDDFDSLAVPVAAVADPAGAVARLARVLAAHDLLRLKGFLAVAGKELRHVVQAVGPRVSGYYDRPWGAGEARAGRLVVIGRKGFDRTAVTSAISAAVSG
jgi:cobalamin biosynthesis protein CobW